MIEKVVGPECPHCGCHASETSNTKLATIYGRQPGSSQLVLLAEETRDTRLCDHCRRTFTITIKRKPPVAIAGPPQTRCHFCGSTVRELESSRPTRSGIIYKRFQCRDCHGQFRLTIRPRHSA